jgi:hypothetical protein
MTARGGISAPLSNFRGKWSKFLGRGILTFLPKFPEQISAPCTDKCTT